MSHNENWSVAVYLAGGEGLSAGMIRSLQDLRDESLRPKGIEVLAQFEPHEKVPRMFAFTEREEVPAGLVPSGPRAASPIGLSNFEYVSEQPPRHAHSMSIAGGNLGRFVEMGRDRRGDRHFMLVLSGHGNGAVGELFGYRGLERALALRDLRPVLRDASVTPSDKIDVVGMDCCNMSMIEVGFELAPYAGWLVASESVVPTYGWPYRQMLDRIRNEEPAAAARAMAREFVDFYADYALTGVSAHCGAIELAGIEALAAPVRRLSETLIGQIHRPEIWHAVVLAHWEAQSYKDEEYVDLADLCARFVEHVDDDAIRRESVEVMHAVGEVVGASFTTGAGFQYSTGLSIYFPWCNDAAKGRGETGARSDLEDYKGLIFNERTMWGEFIDVYLDVTQRDRPEIDLGRREEERSPAHRLADACEASLAAPARSPLADEVSVRRMPPVGRGTSVPAPAVKNHPREPAVGLEDESGVRRMPPVGRGTSVPAPAVKNHPREPAVGLEGESGVRRMPPVGRGTSVPAPAVKNHPREPAVGLEDESGVRRMPPVGRGGRGGIAKLKNHPRD